MNVKGTLKFGLGLTVEKSEIEWTIELTVIAYSWRWIFV